MGCVPDQFTFAGKNGAYIYNKPAASDFTSTHINFSVNVFMSQIACKIFSLYLFLSQNLIFLITDELRGHNFVLKFSFNANNLI